MKKDEKSMPKNGAEDQSKTFFIIGTVGELTVAECPKRQCTFELIPDEEMKTERNGKAGYLWLPSAVDANGVGQVITRNGKVANIDFTKNRSRFLQLLITAKVNAMKIRVEVQNDPLAVIITFVDHGVPYDPLAKDDPDITLSAEERQIGGLGIYMVKKSMDDISYESKDGQNILRIKKNM